METWLQDMRQGALFLAAVALVATWLPARRALAVEPTTAIRGE